MIAVKRDVSIPIESVMAKPLIGPVPNVNRTSEAINVVTLASVIVANAFWYPALILASISAGYQKAFATITDANVTTLIASLVLFTFGTGPIKGFAITLSIGILTSLFTAIIASRALVNLVYGGKTIEKLRI